MARTSGRSDIVSMRELRRMLRLVNDLRDLPGGSDLRWRHAVEGLCSLVGAYVGIAAELRGMSSGRVAMASALDLGWADQRTRTTFQSYLQSGEPHSVDPSLERLARAARPGVSTFLRDDLLGKTEWYSCPHVEEARRAADVDSFIYTTFAIDDDRAMAIGLHRPWGDRPFSERERAMVDVFYSECTFLHPSGAQPLAGLDGLPPRLADTVRGLLRGKSEKEVAADLGISPHTVHDYVKALHRRFGARSRAELFALFKGTGDGNDR